MAGSDAIVLEGVWKYFGDYPAIRDVSFRLPQSECLALIGRNGAGKTTLLRMLGGFSRPAKGAIQIAGTNPRETATRKAIGIIGHGISVYDELSALENLRLFAKIYELPDAEKRAAELLERVGLWRVREGLVREFSRGMRQRLAIARAFLHQPTVLLLDEPFTSLDDRAIAVLQSLLAEAAGRGASIVMSTHQIREAMELATRVVLLERGKLVFTGPRTPEMMTDPGWVYAHYGDKG
jgi:heme exporter protein A